jgi:hypothetical protein
MGLADLPRAIFSGFAHWNPSTMNNNDSQPSYDPATATLNWPWLERHGLQDETDFDSYVTGNGIVPSPNDQMLGEFFDPTSPPAEWNFYGDMACGFVQPDVPKIEWPAKFSKPSGGTTITGFVDDRGVRVTSGDPWIGQPVQLNAGLDAARLVDVDPVAAWSSQIFLDTLSVGSAATGAGVVGRPDGRSHSRWVFFNRNLNLDKDVIIAGIGSAMFQVALPTESLSFYDATPDAGSLAALFRQALARPDVRGLMARFVTYHTVYFQGDAFPKPLKGPAWSQISALYHEYAGELRRYERGERGEPPPLPVNRAYSNVVGWIAPWTRGDMRTMAVGRILHAHGKIQPVDRKVPATSLGPAALEYTVDPKQPSMVGRVSLDLGTATPELNAALRKVDFGRMQLALEPEGGGAAKPFAEIPYAGGYDAAAYVAAAGVVDIPASSFLAQVSVADIGHRLVVQFVSPEGTVQVGLREADLTAETEDRAVYLDEPGAQGPPAERSVTIEVRHRGGPPPVGTRLRVAQYSPAPPGYIEFGWKLVSEQEPGPSEPGPQAPFARMTGDGTVVDGAYLVVPVAVEPGASFGTARVAVAALRPGPPVLQFAAFGPRATVPAPARAVGFFNTAQEFFANVRVLPFHNDMASAFDNWLRTGPSVDVVSQRAFDAVFRTFFLMYPVMRFIGDPLQFQAWRGQILEATDPARFESPLYMPVSRSLSAGQRRILTLWCGYLDGTLTTPTHLGGRIGRRG